MKVLIINQNKSDNIGDKLLSKMLCERLNNLGVQTKELGFAQTKEQNVTYEKENSTRHFLNSVKRECPMFIKYLLNFGPKLRKQQKKVKMEEYEAIVIGGGQLIKHKSVFLYCLIYWAGIAKKYSVPFAFYGIGIDNNLTFAEKKLYKRVFSKAFFVNCRDMDSAQMVKSFFGIEAQVSPDIAFTYCPTQNSACNEKKKIDYLVMPYSYTTAQSAFGLSLLKIQYYDGIFKEMNIKEETRIVLAATTSSDAGECIQFKEYLSTKNVNAVINITSTAEELSNLFSDSEVIITGRMHAMIIAMLCGCKITPIRVSDKINTFEKDYLLSSKRTISNIKENAIKGVDTLFKSLQQFQI